MSNSHGRLPEASLNASGMRRGLGISATSPYTDQCSDRCSDHTDQASGRHSCHGNLRISRHIQLAIPDVFISKDRILSSIMKYVIIVICVPSKVPNFSFHFSLGRYSTSKHILLSLKFKSWNVLNLSLRIPDPTLCLTCLTHLNRRDFSPGQLPACWAPAPRSAACVVFPVKPKPFRPFALKQLLNCFDPFCVCHF